MENDIIEAFKGGHGASIRGVGARGIKSGSGYRSISTGVSGRVGGHSMVNRGSVVSKGRVGGYPHHVKRVGHSNIGYYGGSNYDSYYPYYTNSYFYPYTYYYPYDYYPYGYNRYMDVLPVTSTIITTEEKPKSEDKLVFVQESPKNFLNIDFNMIVMFVLIILVIFLIIKK